MTKSQSLNVRSAVAILTVTVANLIVFFLFFVKVPDTNKELLNFVIGSIMGALTTTLSFYFGDNARTPEDNKSYETRRPIQTDETEPNDSSGSGNL